jgi:4-amino-4-deoxy-L-arabinose transferase-like glycosyltransferase
MMARKLVEGKTHFTERLERHIRSSRRCGLRGLILVVILAILARIAFYFVSAQDCSYKNMEIDGWLQTAQFLVSGGGYSRHLPGIPTARRGPVVVYLFAAILSVFGQQSLAIIIAQWIIDAGTCVMLYLLALELFNDRRVAFASSLLFAFYVPEMTFTLRAWSEPLFSLLLIAFTLSFLRTLRFPVARLFALTGVLLGLTILARPSMQFYPLVVFILTFWNLGKQWRVAVKGLGILSITLAIVLAPWIIRNYLVFGHFIPASTQGGYPLFESNHALGEPDFLRYRVHNESATVLIKTLEPRIGPTSDPSTIFLHAWMNGMSEYEVEQVAQQQAIQIILAHPDRYVILCLVRFIRLWFNLGYGTPSSWQSYMAAVANAVLLMLALAAFLFHQGPWVKRAAPLVAVVAFNTAVYTATQALVRYSMPVMPYVILAAAFTLVKSIPSDWRLAQQPDSTLSKGTEIQR